jgi:hypothetical protein
MTPPFSILPLTNLSSPKVVLNYLIQARVSL